MKGYAMVQHVLSKIDTSEVFNSACYIHYNWTVAFLFWLLPNLIIIELLTFAHVTFFEQITLVHIVHVKIENKNVFLT